MRNAVCACGGGEARCDGRPLHFGERLFKLLSLGSSSRMAITAALAFPKLSAPANTYRWHVLGVSSLTLKRRIKPG